MNHTKSICLMLLLLGCKSSLDQDQAKILIAASNMKHPPFSSWDESGKAVGFEVEVVEEAAHELGLKVRWVERPFAELLSAIESDEIDIAVSTIGLTEERRLRVGFSEPYYQTSIVALVSNKAESIRTLNDLAEATIGADQATTSYDAAKARWPRAKLVGQVAEGITWPQMVESGQIDAFVVDESDQVRLESESGISLRKIPAALSSEFMAVALDKNDHDLRAALNRAIRRLIARENFHFSLF